MLHQLKDCHSIEQVFDQADMNWLAEEVPIMTGDGKVIETHKAIRREDTGVILGVTGRKYRIIQHSQAFAILDVLANNYRAAYKTAGLIGNGRRVVVQAKIGNAFDIARGDTHEKWLTCVNSFDSSLSCKCYFTARRIRCGNEIHASLRSHGLCISIRHTASADDRIREGLRIFALAGDYFKEYRDKALALSQKTMDAAMTRRFLDSVIGEAESTRKQNQRDNILERFAKGRGNDEFGYAGSAFSAVNAVSEWVDHERNADDVDARLFGSGATLKNTAFNAALAL